MRASELLASCFQSLKQQDDACKALQLQLAGLGLAAAKR